MIVTPIMITASTKQVRKIRIAYFHHLCLEDLFFCLFCCFLSSFNGCSHCFLPFLVVLLFCLFYLFFCLFCFFFSLFTAYSCYFLPFLDVYSFVMYTYHIYIKKTPVFKEF